MVSIRHFTIGFLSLVFLGSGCSSWIPRPVVSRVAPEINRIDFSAPIDVREVGKQVVWAEPKTPRVGETVLSFTLHTSMGAPLSSEDLILADEKKMHAIFVREDFSDFQHLYPEVTRDEWSVRPHFAEAGTYHLYFDYASTIQGRSVLHDSFVVPGRAAVKTVLPKRSSSRVVVDGITASLARTPLENNVGTTTQLTFQLLQRDQPVQELGPYLGAFGHVTLLEEEQPSRYLEARSLTNAQPQDGRITFEVRFPEQGIYHAYAEFNVAGSIKVFPFIIEVKEDEIQCVH